MAGAIICKLDYIGIRVILIYCDINMMARNVLVSTVVLFRDPEYVAREKISAHDTYAHSYESAAARHRTGAPPPRRSTPIKSN